jgi:hypothetical protein
MKIVDGDSHFIEPLDLFLQYIEPAYRDRAMCRERPGDRQTAADQTGSPCGWAMIPRRC